MKHCAALLCALLLALLLPQEGQAHRVNIFAYADEVLWQKRPHVQLQGQ